MVDVDAVGGAVTGGLIGGAIEKPTGKTGEHHNLCADCGTETVGRFCHNCGNASHVHRTLLHLGEEILHGVMHFDSRTWRTLPLLVFRPGRLTREWCEGKRTRYVSPLAIFLFTVFVMFMLLSYAPAPEGESPVARQAVATADLARKNTALAEARRELNDTPEGPARQAAQVAVDLAQKEVDRAKSRVGNTPKAAEVDNWQSDLSNDVKTGKLNVSLGNKKLEEKIEHKLENPELALYKLQQTFYKFSFLLVPISIPFVALLFLWKRGFTLYDHGVFVLYSLTFMSLLIMVVAAAMRVGGLVGTLAVASVPFVVPIHMYYQLQGAYGLRTFSAMWRTWFLLIFCSIAAVFFLLAIIWLGMA
ncbi:MAG: DUF3667 domain-containing protein [Pseudomonadota bacterium]